MNVLYTEETVSITVGVTSRPAHNPVETVFR
jgi:hypothetical protein